MKKQWIALLSAGVLAFSVGIGFQQKVTAKADEINSKENYQTIKRGGGILIEQRGDSVIKSYRRNLCTTRTLNIKDKLVELGMGQGFVERISSQSLYNYSIAEEISVNTTYYKTTEDGKTTTVSEEEAVSMLNQTRDNIMAREEVVDSYMRLVYTVSRIGNNYFLFSSDAEWLTMPFYRLNDSLGSAAIDCTVENATRYGWMEYDYTSIPSFGDVVSGHRFCDTENDRDIIQKKNCANQVWYGSVMIFPLPLDNLDSTSGTLINTNLKAHYEYIGVAEHSHFNTKSTYVHSILSINFANTISIGVGGIDGAIGLSFYIGSEARTVELPYSIGY